MKDYVNKKVIATLYLKIRFYISKSNFLSHNDLIFYKFQTIICGLNIISYHVTYNDYLLIFIFIICFYSEAETDLPLKIGSQVDTGDTSEKCYIKV